MKWTRNQVLAFTVDELIDEGLKADCELSRELAMRLDEEICEAAAVAQEKEFEIDDMRNIASKIEVLASDSQEKECGISDMCKKASKIEVLASEIQGGLP